MAKIHIDAVNAVAYQEGDVWVVQGVNYDITTHTRDADKIVEALVKAVTENACISQALGREPLEGIKPAPKKFQKMFDQAVTRLQQVAALPPERPVREVDVRLARAAA